MLGGTNLPRVGGSLLLMLLAWLIASVLRTIVVRVLSAFHLDERLGQATRTADAPPPQDPSQEPPQVRSRLAIASARWSRRRSVARHVGSGRRG